MKIGIVRETKNPPDKRVPLTPEQCAIVVKNYPQHTLVVESSSNRCFTDDEYRVKGVAISEDISECDILIGVKEVDIPALLDNKIYMFFSHTAKEQPYNRKLLKEIARKSITLIDYEYLTRRDKTRVVAFGRWAGIVGAYNGIRAYGLRNKTFELKPAWSLKDLDELKASLKVVQMGNARIVLTGGGRVAGGALEILNEAGITEVKPEEYLTDTFSQAVFCRLDPWHYTRRIDGAEFDFRHFIENPTGYENTFLPFANRSDLFIACHFWDPDSPVLLTNDAMKSPGFPVKVIADISCDINGPIPSTIRASTIADPIYGYDPLTGKESAKSFDDNVITVMAVDNLPGELPRNASEDFGNALIDNVIPYLIGEDSEGIVERATIVRNGKLTELFAYLKDYLNG